MPDFASIKSFQVVATFVHRLRIFKLDRALAFLIDSDSLQLSQQVRHFTGLFLSGARSFER